MALSIDCYSPIDCLWSQPTASNLAGDKLDGHWKWKGHGCSVVSGIRQGEQSLRHYQQLDWKGVDIDPAGYVAPGRHPTQAVAASSLMVPFALGTAIPRLVVIILTVPLVTLAGIAHWTLVERIALLSGLRSMARPSRPRDPD